MMNNYSAPGVSPSVINGEKIILVAGDRKKETFLFTLIKTPRSHIIHSHSLKREF